MVSRQVRFFACLCAAIYASVAACAAADRANTPASRVLTVEDLVSIATIGDPAKILPDSIIAAVSS